jgi:hypothetical protein
MLSFIKNLFRSKDHQQTSDEVESLNRRIKQFAIDYIHLETKTRELEQRTVDLELILDTAEKIWDGRLYREKLNTLILEYRKKHCPRAIQATSQSQHQP